MLISDIIFSAYLHNFLHFCRDSSLLSVWVTKALLHPIGKYFYSQRKSFLFVLIAEHSGCLLDYEEYSSPKKCSFPQIDSVYPDSTTSPNNINYLEISLVSETNGNNNNNNNNQNNNHNNNNNNNNNSSNNNNDNNNNSNNKNNNDNNNNDDNNNDNNGNENNNNNNGYNDNHSDDDDNHNNNNNNNCNNDNNYHKIKLIKIMNLH